MARILLAGCGSIGTQLGLALQADGHEVFGLRRSDIALPFPTLQADMSQPLPAGLLPARLDYIVHTGTPSERSDAGYMAGYPAAVQNLLNALAERRLKRFFFISSTAVYAQDDGSWVDETSPTEPQRFNGIRVLEAERIINQSNQPGTSIRFGGIYGPGRTWLLRRVQAGAEVQAQPPKYTNRIHQDDCVGVIKHLLELNEQGTPLADCYVAVDDDPADEATVCSWLALQLKAPPPVPINTDSHASQNKRCSNQRLHDCGYQFRFPSFREGYLS
ncbi:MAG: NAD-dependent epimerase/dehydratase family protein [Ketobacter sp.]|nr:MAG: NAD-dependent epimerase/dehydratase family protein [Ketobacter sp.]